MPGYRKLGRATQHRISMLKSLTTSLFEKRKIKTTVYRAKEIKRLADKIITMAKKNTLHARRQVLRFITVRQVASKLFDGLENYKSRNSGYTKITKTAPRRGDGAQMCVIEFVE